jgi:1,4-dihydroxy-2-naphthoate polyprenyltransferase
VPERRDGLRPKAEPPAGTTVVRWRRIWLDLLVYPTYTLPIALAPVLIGVGLAVHNRVFNPIAVLVAFVASWVIHVGGLMLDNYELLTQHPDNREHPDLVEAYRNGQFSLPALRCAIGLCFVAPLLAGPYLWQVAGPLTVVFGLVGMVSSWGYAGRPIVYARLGLADPIFFAMFGVVAVVGTYYVAAASFYPPVGRLIVTQALPLDAFVLGLPVGALVNVMLLTDDLRDREDDRLKGWRTGAVRFGPAWTRVEIAGLTVLAYLAPFWFWRGLGFTPWVLLPLLTLPLATKMAPIVYRKERERELFSLEPKIAMLVFYYAALSAAGIAAS